MVIKSSATAIQKPSFNSLPETGYVKLWQIIGDKKRNIPAIYPVGRTSWLNGVKSGKYPKPVKIGERSVAWPVDSIRALLNCEVVL